MQYFVVLVSLTIPVLMYSVFANASFKLDIYPETDICVLVNTSFRIKCSVSQTNITSKPSLLQIQRCFQNQTCSDICSSSTDIKKRNGSSLERSFTTHAQALDEGIYNCRYGRQNSSFYPKVYVIEKPILPDSISCVSMDRNEMTCNWRESETRIPTNYTAYYTPWNSNVTRQCLQKIQSGCTWPGPSGANRSDEIFDSSQDIIIITIVGKNFMTNTTKNYRIDISKIVKLSPLVALAHKKTCSSITVHWKLREMFVKRFVEKRITARFYLKSKWGYRMEEQNVIMTSQGSSTFSITFSDLIPFTEYYISMQSKPMSSKHWSDMSSLNVTTDATVPGAAPGLAPSSFYTCTNKARYEYKGDYICVLLKVMLYQVYVGYTVGNAVIPSGLVPAVIPSGLVPDGKTYVSNSISNIYLSEAQNTPIPEKAVNSFFVNYSINVTSTNHSFTKSVDYKAVAIPIMKSTSNSVIHVTIRSYNDVGMSEDQSSATFYTSGLPIPQLVLVNINSEGNYTITWIVDDKYVPFIHDVNVYWCREANGICTRSLEWKSLNGSTTKALNVFNDQRRSSWLFAVGLLTKSGQSGGLTFARKDCEFSDTELGPVATPAFTLRQSPNKAALILEYRFKFCDFRDYPVTYNIYYSHDKSERKSINCTAVKAAGKAQHVKATPRAENFTIEKLNQNTYYVVCMDALLADNTMTQSSQVNGERTIARPSSQDSENQSTSELYIPLAVFGILLLITLFSVCVKRCTETDAVTISIPEIRQTNTLKLEDCDHNKLKLSDSCQMDVGKHENSIVYEKYEKETFTINKIDNMTKSLSEKMQSLDEGFSEGFHSERTTKFSCYEIASSIETECTSLSAMSTEDVRVESVVGFSSGSNNCEDISHSENSMEIFGGVNDVSFSSDGSGYAHVTIMSSSSNTTSCPDDSI